jgi:hypothetical protein
MQKALINQKYHARTAATLLCARASTVAITRSFGFTLPLDAYHGAAEPQIKSSSGH